MAAAVATRSGSSSGGMEDRHGMDAGKYVRLVIMC
jgi:hypothetical protein